MRVGPLAARASSNKVPTVYLVGTHHANEWLGEEVTLQLARWYRDSVTGAGGDPSLVALLQSVAVVFVPVVNPDRYQFTHTQDPNTGYRDHRANKRQTVCNNPFVDGIDLNRNYAYGWGSEADPAVPQCHGQTYPGGAPASEPETLGMQRLLAGQAFTSGTTGQDIQQPAASVSLHSYGNVVLYPPAFRGAADGDPGSPCTILGNCLNTDLPIYRRLFGDTQNELAAGSPGHPMLFDGAVPYPASQELTIRAAVAGDMTLYANHGGLGNPTNVGPHLSITVELGGPPARYPECETDPAAFVMPFVEQQKTLIKKLVQNAAALVSTGPYSTAYAPSSLGVKGYGYLVREAGSGAGRDTARPRVLVGISTLSSASNQPNTITFGGQSMQLQMGHRGVHYQGQYVDLASMPGGPWCLPPLITINSTSSADPPAGVGTGGAGSCIDLSHQQRYLVNGGWVFNGGTRGGQPDYWWEPGSSTTADLTLVVPSFAPPSQVNGMLLTACNSSFSSDWDGQTGTVILERQVVVNGVTQWTAVRSWPQPGAGSAVDHLRTEIIETNPPFVSPPYPVAGRMNSFRSRVPAGQSPGSAFKLFEPVILCRLGAVP